MKFRLEIAISGDMKESDHAKGLSITFARYLRKYANKIVKSFRVASNFDGSPCNIGNLSKMSYEVEKGINLSYNFIVIKEDKDEYQIKAKRSIS